MIGVNSLHSAGRLRSRSLCSVRYGRDFRMMDPFRYPRTPRSRSLKPLVFPDLLGKAQDGQKHPQFRKRKRALYNSIKNEKLQWTIHQLKSLAFLVLLLWLRLHGYHSAAAVAALLLRLI
ncbi:hypothetical protein SRHO_G00155220 [Serrasalmus rhombeus]